MPGQHTEKKLETYWCPWNLIRSHCGEGFTRR